ncbi:MAG: type II toxin-antitoxin system RelE/ParE family toxin [Desulfarculus sp.]|nr:type II toxin-antitoxin system RelE/ParE family toxin [Desulfarculus sp.]
MAPQIIWAGSAARELRKLEREVQKRILAETRRLSLEALPPGSKKLSGHPLHRVRVGDYRIVYQYRAEDDAVVVLKVAHRKDAYQRIPDLK